MRSSTYLHFSHSLEGTLAAGIWLVDSSQVFAHFCEDALYSCGRPKQERCQMMVGQRLESSLCVVSSCSSLRRISFAAKMVEENFLSPPRFSATFFYTMLASFTHDALANDFIIKFPTVISCRRRQQKIPNKTGATNLQLHRPVKQHSFTIFAHSRNLPVLLLPSCWLFVSYHYTFFGPAAADEQLENFTSSSAVIIAHLLNIYKRLRQCTTSLT